MKVMNKADEVKAALDMMATAIESSNHEWTDNELRAYETAIGNIDALIACHSATIAEVERLKVMAEACTKADLYLRGVRNGMQRAAEIAHNAQNGLIDTPYKEPYVMTVYEAICKELAEFLNQAEIDMGCPKCGSENIKTRHIAASSLISSSSTAKVDNEFVRSSEYDYFYKLTAKIEHLLKTCECGYSWRDRVSV